MFVPRDQRIEVGVPALPVSFEIGLATVQYEIKQTLYDGLIDYRMEPDPGGIPRAAIGHADRHAPRLAESWTTSDDGRTITMTLREGVASVTGKLLESEDVRYTFDRGFNVPGYYKWTAQVGGLDSNEDVEIVDRRTIRFHLARPCAYFLDTRTLPMQGIFDAEYLRSQATAADPWAISFVREHDAGFGPYRVEEKRPGEWQTFRARADYYRGKPGFDQVVYRVIPDAAERERLLASGEIDFAHGLSIEQILRLRDQPGVVTAFGPSTHSVQLSLQCELSPFRDVHLRRAVAWAVPYERVQHEVFHGVGRPWRGLIPPVVPGYDESLWPFRTDPVEAREQLARANVPTGFTATIVGSLGVAFHRTLGDLIVEAVDQIGLPARLELVAPEEYARRRSAGQYDALLSGAGPQVPDPGYCLSHDYCSDSEGNDFRYANAEFDHLVAQGLSALDPAARLAYFREAQTVLATDVPVVPLASPGYALAYGTRLGGVTWHPNSLLYFGELTLSGG